MRPTLLNSALIDPSESAGLTWGEREALSGRLRAARDAALARFFSSARGIAEFKQFCTQLMKAAAQAEAAGLRGNIAGLRRQAIVGSGIEAAWRARRAAGAPKKPRPVDLYQHVWLLLNLERESLGEERYARVPAKRIAEYCAEHFPGAGPCTAGSVRKALAGVDLPHYLRPARKAGKK